MSGRRGRRPVLICLIVLCLACVALMTKAVISFVSFSPRYDPVADEPEVLFDLNASDYGERMRIVPLSGDAERSTLHEPGSSVTYVGMSDGASSVIVALDAATAEVRWDARLTDSRPRCVPYGPELRCSTGGELVGISESDGTTTVLTALPSDDYRVSKNQEERITYLLPPVDGRSQDYQVMWIDERDRVVILPWSPPPTPCAEASGTSFKDVDPHTGVGDHDLLAAVVVDGWMVLSAVDTGEIVDQRFGDLRERTGESGPLLSGDEACGSEWSQVDVSYPPPHRTVFSVVPLPAEKVPTSPPADEARPVLWRNGGALDGASLRTASSGNGVRGRCGPMTSSICAVLVWRTPSRTESKWARAPWRGRRWEGSRRRVMNTGSWSPGAAWSPFGRMVRARIVIRSCGVRILGTTSGRREAVPS